MNFNDDMNENGQSEVQSSSTTGSPMRVLMVATTQESRTVSALLAACDMDCSVVDVPGGVHSRLITTAFDVVIVPMDSGALEVCSVVTKLQPNASIIMLAPHANVSDLTQAMQAGATDFLIGPPSSEEIEDRIRNAAVKSRNTTERGRRAERLRGLSRRINDTRRQVLAAIEEHEVILEDPSMPEGISEEPMKVPESETDTEKELATEFREIIRQELDVEDMLRSSLEFILQKTGPTNAAVFLAGGDNGFGLGAYVHYDLTRVMVEPMLQRLANEACPAISDAQDVLRFDDAQTFIKDCNLGEEISPRQQMVAVPCHHDGECMAIMVLFRSEDDPYQDELASCLDVLRVVFAEQLASLIRIHNRLDASWPDEPADEEPGFGDMAA
jgi:DNA-binding response OmpR family regulator